ncbi:MAG TPA: tyrosine-type recombinase/integrase [Gemmatimonadaceae bacterium]|nr:tyrosine-type recombinase/integrase [Gemmatimonadaceae bacterium]
MTWIPGLGWRQKALGTSSRPKAQALGEAFLAALSVPAVPTPAEPLTLGRLWTHYQEESSKFRTNIPRVQREKAARAELLLLGLGARTVVERLTLDDVGRYVEIRRRGTGWRDGRVTEAVRARSIAQDLALLRTIIRWGCKARGPDGAWLVATNPLRGLELPVEANPRRPVATYDRFLAVRAAVGTLAAETPAMRDTWLRLELALVLAEATGRRIGAIAGLRWSDVGQDPPAITWREEFDKRRREATVPVPAALVEDVMRCRARVGAFTDGWIFAKPSDPAGRWHPKRFDTLLRRAEAKAQVPPLAGGLWHPYRRKWATERKHLPPVDVMAAGGWTTREIMESCYQHATAEAVLDVMSSAIKLRDRKVSGKS